MGMKVKTRDVRRPASSCATVRARAVERAVEDTDQVTCGDAEHVEVGDTEEVQYEVEEIIAVDVRTDRFLVRWVGYGPDDNSWEERNRLDGAPELMRAFEAAQQRPAKRVRVSVTTASAPARAAQACAVTTRKPTVRRPTAASRPAAGTPIRSRAAAALPQGAHWMDSSQQAALALDVHEQDGPPAFTREAFQARALALEAASREQSTRKLYGAHWCTFVCWLLSRPEWRDIVDASNNVNLPVPLDAVCEYAAFLSYYLAPGTIDIALSSISAIHEHASLESPAAQRRVRRIVEGLRRRWITPRRAKMILLPQHVRAFMQLLVVRSGPACDGQPWSAVRLQRAQAAVVIGFIAFLRKTELHALDKCDVLSPAAAQGRDVLVRHAKNDPRGEGRSSVVGNVLGDGTGVCELLDSWEPKLSALSEGPCTKSRDRRAHCKACGWYFPRIGARPARLVRDPDHRAYKTTTDFITKDVRQMLRQLQHDEHPDVDPDLDVDAFTAVCLRRAGNSVAAAEGVASALRQVQGRWLGETTHDQHYMDIHRTEFTSMGQTLMLSGVGSAAPGRRVF